MQAQQAMYGEVAAALGRVPGLNEVGCASLGALLSWVQVVCLGVLGGVVVQG